MGVLSIYVSAGPATLGTRANTISGPSAALAAFRARKLGNAGLHNTFDRMFTSAVLSFSAALLLLLLCSYARAQVARVMLPMVVIIDRRER